MPPKPIAVGILQTFAFGVAAIAYSAQQAEPTVAAAVSPVLGNSTSEILENIDAAFLPRRLTETEAAAVRAVLDGPVHPAILAATRQDQAQ